MEKKGYRKWLSTLAIITLALVVSMSMAPISVRAASGKAKSIALDHSTYTLKKGSKVRLKATITPKKARDKKVTWSSSKRSVASVNSKGVVKGRKKGSATITAAVKGTSLKASCKIKVGAPVAKITLNRSKINLKIGEATTVKASVSPKKAANKAVTYKSSKPAVASVNTKGKITAKKEGVARITVKAKDGSGKKATATVTVKKADIAVEAVKVTAERSVIKVGETISASAQIIPSDASMKKVNWSSSDPSVATVDSNGKITGVHEGTVIITASAANGRMGSVKINVAAAGTPSPTVTETPTPSVTETPTPSVTETPTPSVTGTPAPSTPSIPSTPSTPVVTGTPVPVPTSPTEVVLDKTAEAIDIGGGFTLNAIVKPDSAVNKTVNWSSSDEAVATVENGKVTGIKAGTATITAVTADGGKTATCEITVGTVTEVADFAGMQEALAAGGISKVICNTQESDHEIPAGDHSDVVLVVNAPNATIINAARFKKIEIQAIGKDTWIEKGDGNAIDVTAEAAHVRNEETIASIQMSQGAKNVEVENEGTIGEILLLGDTDLFVSGENRNQIPVMARASGNTLETSIPVAVDTSDDITLIFRTGAESSSVEIHDHTVNATIQGLGTIQVTDRQTNETEYVVAENIGGETAKGRITGTVRGQTEDGFSNIAGAQIYVIPYQSVIDESTLDPAIAGAGAEGRLYEGITDENGSYTIDEIPYGNYTFVVKADGLKTHFGIVTLNRELFNNEATTLMIPSDETGSVKGFLTDAVDEGRGIPQGITLRLREGANNVSGSVVRETYTDADGAYSFESLEPGTYTIQIIDRRADAEISYSTTYFTVVITANTETSGNMSISPIESEGLFQFVLHWGTEAENVPADLDSHLLGPAAGGKFHTFYADPTYHGEEGERYADLDRDDTDYEGPETTTVRKASDGLYHFYVYDFTNQGNEKNPQMATSQAFVEVFVGGMKVATYYVPDQIGTLWDVCTYDFKTNTLTPINKVTFHPGDSDDVGLEPLDIAKRRLSKTIEKDKCKYFGEALAAEVTQKLADAQSILEGSNDYDEVVNTNNDLEGYFCGLEDSTRIADITSEGLQGYHITGQGSWYDDDSGESILLDKYSVIELQGYDEGVWNALSIDLMDEDASCQILDPDKEGYRKMAVVTNSRTRAVVNYYLKYREYVPSLYPQKIEDPGNHITDFSDHYEDDKDGNGICFLDIYGENDQLAAPIFTFENNVAHSYTVTDENGSVGKLTATYKDTEKVYYIRYSKKLRELYVDSIKLNGGEASSLDQDWVYDDETGEEHRIYSFTGTKSELDDQVLLPEFYARGIYDDQETVSVDSWKVDPVEGGSWNYILTAVYKGETTQFYLNYQQEEMISEMSSADAIQEDNSVNEKAMVVEEEIAPAQ